MQQKIENMPTVVQDLLSLLHEDWMPEKRKESIKRMLMDMIDRMDDMESNSEWQ